MSFLRLLETCGRLTLLYCRSWRVFGTPSTRAQVPTNLDDQRRGTTGHFVGGPLPPCPTLTLTQNNYVPRRAPLPKASPTALALALAAPETD